MSVHCRAVALGCCLAVCAPEEPASARQAPTPQARPDIDAVLRRYTQGDADVVSRTFQRPGDYQAALRLSEPRELERWLGPFDRGKAVLLLALARQAVAIAPHYPGVLLRAGRRYVAAEAAGNAAPGSAEFAPIWHRAAAGILEGVGNPEVIEEHVDALDAGRRGSPPSAQVDGRLVFARAVAQERRCWAIRPSLDQPGVPIRALTKAAAITVRPDLDGARKASREKDVAVHLACLRELVTRFDAARRFDDSRAEASVRGGWALYQLDRFGESLAWLDGVKADGDRDLSYWRELFRGRALDALDRHADSAAAYRAALELYPAAQSAGIGLALELLRLQRPAEADSAARAVRAAGAEAPDPWTRYLEADLRFVDGWIDQLKAVAG